MRGHRPAQDGLPRSAQPHGHRRRDRQHRGQPRRGRSTSTRSRSTTRRPTSCSPAATRSACSSWTAAPCATCCGACSRPTFEDIVAVGALYRPGPMGVNAHNDYADRKNGRQKIKPIHPELRGPAQGDPRRDLRPDRLPGADHVHRPAGRGLLAWAGGRAPPAMGKKKKEVLDKEFEGFQAGMRSDQAASPTRRSRPCGTRSSRSPGYAFNKSHAAALRPGRRTGPRTSRRTIRPSTWPRCSRRSADNKDKSAVYLVRVPPARASRCCRRTSTSRACASPRSAPTSASAWARSATSARTSSSRSSRPARSKGKYTSLHRLPGQVGARGAATSG